MAVCYLDCSVLMRELLPADVAARSDFHVHMGDPAPFEVGAIVGDARVVMNGHTRMGARELDACHSLRSIVFLGSGASDYIDLEAARAKDIAVRTIHNYGNRSIAEHTVGLFFAAARQIVAMDAELRHGVWNPREGKELHGATLGVIGAGGIGLEVVGVAQALGMEVLIWNRSRLESPFRSWQTELPALLAQSDIVSLHLKLNDETRHFIGAAELKQMKEGAILVNTARGALVDESALLQALRRANGLGHAALDVFDQEPLPDNHPFLLQRNVTLTSHAAFKTRQASQRLLLEGLEHAFDDLDNL